MHISLQAARMLFPIEEGRPTALGLVLAIGPSFSMRQVRERERLREERWTCYTKSKGLLARAVQSLRAVRHQPDLRKVWVFEWQSHTYTPRGITESETSGFYSVKFYLNSHSKRTLRVIYGTLRAKSKKASHASVCCCTPHHFDDILVARQFRPFYTMAVSTITPSPSTWVT